MVRYASRDTLSRSVGQLYRKEKYGGYSAYPMQKSTLYKIVSGNVVAQSIGFRVISIYWHGVAPFP